jgi:tRNA pseudouridine32 synthase/23S rRNA pseudouridine746 synthase
MRQVPGAVREVLRQGDAADVPARMPSPFAREPSAIARRAAEALIAELAGARGRLGLDRDGKMFGVLVIADAGGHLGVLRAFSGMLGGSWHVDGFAPPVFDDALRARVWPAGEHELARIDAELAALDTALAAPRAELAAIDARHAETTRALAAQHRARRLDRHALRASLALIDARRPTPDGAADTRASDAHALAQQSRADTAERRRHDAAGAAERAPSAARVHALAAERAAMIAHRAARSRELLAAIYDSYLLPNARSERRPMRALFAPDEPPGGAGDCAAPKLLAHAYRLGLRPIALAEVWLGAPPATGGRADGAFYPACRGKCGPILAFMLEGVDVEPAPLFGDAPIDPSEPRTLFEDDALVIVAKPCGLLSVPGRSGRLRDSVQTRLAARVPGTTVVHRLDLDTSGVLLAARSPEVHAALQRAFARREIDKRYVAIVDGDVRGDAGLIELPIRVDLDDRPRQLVDDVHGKPAITRWRVCARGGGTTRVELIPRTGRTHQLRVHCAHARGLGAPIAGDPLYGRAAARLMLHAESIAFAHPITGARVEVTWPAPF